jgi:Domain of unknown function (DUF5666)
MIELHGALSELRGSCPNVTFTLSGRAVAADASTKFEKRSCGALKNGTKIEVKGRTQPDDTVRASKIEIKDDDDDHGGH